MSGPPTHVVRRGTVSPKQGPLKATVPITLMHQTCSPTRCLLNSPSNSPPTNNPQADKRIVSTDATSTTPPALKVDKSKTLTKPGSAAPYIRRTASVDTIYLLGQWQRDALYLSYCGRLMMDRATQTPEEFDDLDKRTQKKNSAASSETLEMKIIRQRLQRTNQNSRGAGQPISYQRHSPVQGDHSAISLLSASGGSTSPVVPSSAAISPHRQLFYISAINPTPPPATAAASSNGNNTNATYSSFTAAAAASGSERALPIPIPDIPKPLIPRMRNSVEGLNQEIERLVLKEISSVEGSEAEWTLDPTPEGHRAPIADLFRTTQRQSVDTQTLHSRRDSSQSSNSSVSRSSSISPDGPIIHGQMDSSRPSSTEENRLSGSPEVEGLNKLATSPHINKFLAREPPDGCEKVKIAEESRTTACLGEPQEYGYLKPSMNFVLLPSQRSAFYPLCKNCVMATSEDVNSEHSSATIERLQ